MGRANCRLTFDTLVTPMEHVTLSQARDTKLLEQVTVPGVQ